MAVEVFVFPASFAQQRLWFLNQLEPRSPAYNIPAAVRLEGWLNLEALERSLHEVVRRHESLRTTFAVADGQPVQVIAPTLPLTLQVVELEHLSADERDAATLRMAGEEAREPFDLSVGPLLRARLLKLSEDEHVLLLTMHHIVSDGWSAGVFIREMAALYETFSRGDESPLEELPIQYADYAEWQREHLRGEVLEGLLQYWKAQLGGPLPVLQLPTDRPRQTVQGNRGARIGVKLGTKLTEQLKELSRREGATLFMTLLASFDVLLYRYTGQEDVLVGTDVANRNRSEIEGLIGFFVNMLVMRANLSGTSSFRELLGRVREVALGAYAHQDLPFERLVEELQPERSLSYNPLFQVAFVLHNTLPPALALPNLKLSPVEVSTGAAIFDLLLSMAESPNGLIATLNYNADLYDDITITRMLEHFKNLLESIVANPDELISELRLLRDEATGGLSAADFPDAGLSQQDFENLILGMS